MVYHIVSNFMTVASCVAAALNVLLMPVIYFRSGKEIGSYKFLLFSYCFIAVIYTSIAVFMVPVFEPSEKGWIFYATVQRVGIELGSYLVAQFAACYIMLLLVLEYSFVYRYFVMCAREQLRWFRDPKRIVASLCLYCFVVACTAGPVFVYMRQNPQLAENFAKDGMSDMQLDLYTISYIGAPMFEPEGGIVVKTAIILSIWTITILSSCCVCAFCIIKIMKAFRATVGFAMSPSQRKLQTRLFLLLVFQTLAPVCFTFFPGLLSYILGYLRIHTPMISQGSTAVLPLAQVIDPFLIFYMVTDYRNFIVGIFKKLFSLKNAVSDVIHSSFSQRSNEGQTIHPSHSSP